MVIQSKVVYVGEFGKSVATGQFIKLDKTNKYDDWDSTYEWVVVGAPAQTVHERNGNIPYKDPKSFVNITVSTPTVVNYPSK